MNTLDYAILGLLARGSYSGYDLMQRLEILWKSKHSQIYLQLTRLEQEGYITFERISQTTRPDKKVYSLTDQGSKALEDWLPELPDEPALRDELLIKIFSIWLIDPVHAKNLFEHRLALYTKKLASYTQRLEQIQHSTPTTIPPITSPDFGMYILLKKATRHAQEEIDWCQQVLQLIEQAEAARISTTVNEID